MHSARTTTTGSSQAHNIHPLQQQLGQINNSSDNIITSSSNSSVSLVSTSTTNQSAMLSAGPPTVPSGIFRTGADNQHPSLRFTASSSYVPAQYSSIYGVGSRSPSHTATVQPYSTSAFFSSFGGSGAPGHSFCHQPLMPATSQSHYPQIESYSAMLASMGVRVQHHGTQVSDRVSRMSAPGVHGSQQLMPAPGVPGSQQFLPPPTHLAASAGQYSSRQSGPHVHRSDTGSQSPGLPRPSFHSPGSSSAHQDMPSSHHLEKMSSMKAGASLQGRDGGDVARELRLYGNPVSGHEDKVTLSPTSYSATGHVPKVSFDTVVKEYGGNRDYPVGRGDMYIRTPLSGKEGSLKHRILIRPSDSDIPEELSKVTGIQGLKDEPSPKRPRISNLGSAAYGNQVTPVLNTNSDQSSDIHRFPRSHPTSHNSVSKTNTNHCRRTESSTNSDQSAHEYIAQRPTSHQQVDSTDRRPDTGSKQHRHNSSPCRNPTSSLAASDNPVSNLQYPPHFSKGSIIQLADGSLKRVEDLQTEDFVSSAEISTDLKVDSSMVVKIEEHQERGTAMLSFCVGEHRVPVTVEAALEHPFYVFGQGWSSCSVFRTLARYGLDCQKLNVGDVCISLTHKDVSLKAAELGQQRMSSDSDPRYQFTMTTNVETSSHQHRPPPGTSPAVSTNCSSASAPSLSPEHTSANILPSPIPPASSPVVKKQPPQSELPPPSTNIVLVNKDSNKKDNHRPATDFIQKESPAENESVSVVSKHHRRQSVPDESSINADSTRQKDERMKDEVAETHDDDDDGGERHASTSSNSHC